MMFFLAAGFRQSSGSTPACSLSGIRRGNWYFLVGIPLLMIQNAATVYLVYLFLAAD